ncbi:hypothetical protein QY96_00095 [Bacillus thermotolerans]|nr:hypothetical protein QY96_00095 [Bacillus thermotolerans]
MEYFHSRPSFYFSHKKRLFPCAGLSLNGVPGTSVEQPASYYF